MNSAVGFETKLLFELGGRFVSSDASISSTAVDSRAPGVTAAGSVPPTPAVPAGRDRFARDGSGRILDNKDVLSSLLAYDEAPQRAGLGSTGRSAGGSGGGGGGGGSVGSSGVGGGTQFAGGGAQGGMFAAQRDLNGELVVRGQDLVYVFGQANNRINKG